MGKITFWHLLGLLFLYLKLTGHIDWHWWWVVSPLTFVFITSAFRAVMLKGYEIERNKKAEGMIDSIDKILKNHLMDMEDREK